MDILVIAAHPDDEVIGMGATIKKLSRKNHIALCVVSEGASAQYSNKEMIAVRRKACIKSSKILGITDIIFLDFPDMKLDSVPQLEINRELEKIIKEMKPEIIFTTPHHDLNKDHQIVFDSTLVAARPLSSSIKEIYCYELSGIVKEAFRPNIFVDISNELSYKIKAFKMYKSEIKKFPHARSFKSIENLSVQRGVESGLESAEAFELIRKIVSGKNDMYS